MKNLAIYSLLLDLLLSMAFAFIGSAATASQDESEKPVLIEADKVTVDYGKKIQLLEGNASIHRGNDFLLAQRIEVQQDEQGFLTGTAYGYSNKQAEFRSTGKSQNSKIDGWADRIMYQSRSELVDFIGKACLHNAGNKVCADHIFYDGKSRRYIASSGDKKSPEAPASRVRVIIAPNSARN